MLDSDGVTCEMIDGKDRVLAARDRRHVDHHVVVFERDIAVGFAERTFGLEIFGIDIAFDYDFGLGWNQKIDRLGLDDIDRHAGEPAGNRHLVETQGQLLRSLDGHQRRAAQHDRDRHLFLLLLELGPVGVPAGAKIYQGHQSEP